MLVYFLTIFFMLVVSYRYYQQSYGLKTFNYIIFTFLFMVIYGFRYQVGVDWNNYIRMYERVINGSFSFFQKESLYKAINVIASYTDNPTFFIIFVCTFLFWFFSIIGAIRLRINPYLFFAIVAPYHLVMSGVNYTRQGVALSIFIYAISYLFERRKKYFFFYIILASTFHVSVLCFVLFLFIDNRKRFLIPLSVISIPVFVVYMLGTYDQYIDSDVSSKGVFLRALFLLVPCLFIFLSKVKLSNLDIVYRRLVIITYLSFPFIVSISLISTTIADRFSYYFILINTIVWMKIRQSNEAKKIKFDVLCVFLASMLAFAIWIKYTKYIEYYQYDSYINHWVYSTR